MDFKDNWYAHKNCKAQPGTCRFILKLVIIAGFGGKLLLKSFSSFTYKNLLLLCPDSVFLQNLDMVQVWLVVEKDK
ncbi:hypothetical protein P8452_77111 [Trifolium repens]|nr:hypothetical protein P8452_77111 [Trifolium repens]